MKKTDKVHRYSMPIIKFDLKMKLTVLFLITTLFVAKADTTYAQKTRITINLSNVSIQEVMDEIESITHFKFFVNVGEINTDEKISVNFKDKTVDKILRKVFSKQKIDLRIIDKQIIINKNKVENTSNLISKALQNKITGTILDTNGTPLPGANILEKETKNGTQSDFDGNFSILVKDENATLVISYIGFISQEIALNNQKDLIIKLKEDTAGLDEVVVIGYGSVKKSDLTGAVSTIKASDLPEGASPTVESLLAGKVAGLTVNQTSAQPGGGFSVLIRGAASGEAGNTPLYVIDGFPVTTGGTEAGGGAYNPGSRGSLNSLNSNDIASIEVLKDASATAIYGARAANGVVLITTKRGKEGDLKINVSSSYSSSTASNAFNFLNASDLMREKARDERERWLFRNNIAPYGTVDETSISPAFSAPFTAEEIATAGEGTDWFDEISRMGQTHEHNISMASGTEKTKYFTSFNYFNQEGVIKNSGLKRYTGRFNLDQKINAWLDFQVNLTVSHIDNQNSQLGGSKNDNSGIIASAYQFPSYLPVKDDEGNYVLNLDRPNIPNPVSLLEIDDVTKSNRFLTNAKLTAQIFKGLTWSNSIGLDTKNAKRLTYLPKTTLYGALANGRASNQENRNYSLLYESVLNYTNNDLINNLNFTVLGGFSYQNFQSEGFHAQSKDFITDLFLYNNLSAGVEERPYVDSWRSASKLASYFSRIQLSYFDKYLLTATVRADGSDKFGKNNKYGYFPSIAVGWKLQNENFLKNVEALSELKLRLSYGQTGNSNIGGNAFSAYKTGSNYAFGNTINAGVTPSRLENPNLKWETTTDFNVGLDFGFFQNKISGTVEYFNKEVSDLLDYKSLPSFSPVGSIADNVGINESKGWEVLLNSKNIQKDNFYWNTTLSLAHFADFRKERNDDVVLKVYETEMDSRHSIFGYLSDGIVQIGQETPHLPNAIPGDLNIRDINGQDEEGNLTGEPDGIIDDADKVILGYKQPDLTFGLNNTFNIGDFDLNIYMYGEIGRDRYNDTRATFSKIDVNNALVDAKDRWASDNTSGTLPSGISSAYSGSATDLFIEDASFLRLRNITLGYTLKDVIKGIGSLRLYVDAQNLFVISNYTSGDPETDSFSAYPFPKTYKLGLNINF